MLPPGGEGGGGNHPYSRPWELHVIGAHASPVAAIKDHQGSRGPIFKDRAT